MKFLLPFFVLLACLQISAAQCSSAISATGTASIGCESSNLQYQVSITSPTVAPVVVGGTANPTPDTPVPDVSTTGASSTISVTGGLGVVLSTTVVSVLLNLPAASCSDVDAFLIGPGNCGTLELTTDNGSTGGGYNGTWLSTSLTNVIGTAGNNTAPFTGSYAPEGTILDNSNAYDYASLPAADIYGCPINGSWKLMVFDDNASAATSISSWSLVIGNCPYFYNFSGLPSGASLVEVSVTTNTMQGNATVSNLPIGSYNVPITVTNGVGTTTVSVPTKVFDKPEILSVDISPDCNIGSGATVTVGVSGINNANFTGVDFGFWQYSMDSIAWQSAHIFGLVASGSHKIYVRNAAHSDCVTSMPFMVGAPTLTPNSSGIYKLCKSSSGITSATIGAVASGGPDGSGSFSQYQTCNFFCTPFDMSSLPCPAYIKSMNMTGAGSISASSTVSVTLNINSGWMSDLDLFLVGPGNCGTLELATDIGGTSDNFNDITITTAAGFPSITTISTNPASTGFLVSDATFMAENTLTTPPNLADAGGNYLTTPCMGTTTYVPNQGLAGCPVAGEWKLVLVDDWIAIPITLLDWKLHIEQPNANYSYAFATNEPGVAVTSNAPTGAIGQNITAVATNLQPGLTDVYVTAFKNGCTSAQDTITIKVYDRPTYNAALTYTTCASTGNPGCINLSASLNNADFTIPADIGVIQYGSSVAGPWTNLTGPICGLAPGTYTFYLRNSASPGASGTNACTSGPFSIVLPNATPTIINIPATVGCANPTTTLTATPQASPASQTNNSYLWSTGATTQSIVASPTAQTLYCVTATSNVNTQCKDTACISVTSGIPTITISPTNGIVACGSTGAPASFQINYSTTTGGPVTYSLIGTNALASNASNFTPVIDAPLTGLPILANLISGPTGTYTFSFAVKNANGCQSLPTTITVSKLATPASPLILPTTSVSIGCATPSATLSISAPVGTSIYQWSSIPVTTGTSFVTNTANTPISTIYTVTVTASNGCTNTATKSVTVSGLPVITIVPSSLTTTCTAPTGTLLANVSAGPSGATTYAWGPAAGLSNTTIANPTANPTVTTTYTVTVTKGGCTATKTVLVTVSEQPASVSLSSSANFVDCNNNMISLTASATGLAPFSYNWSPTDQVSGVNNGNTIIANPTANTGSQTYTVTVTAANGCTSVGTKSITINSGDPISVSISSNGNFNCGSNVVGLTAMANLPFTAAWSAGTVYASVNSVTVSSSATYTVTATSLSGGCTATSSIQTATDNMQPNISITASPSTVFSTTVTAIDLILQPGLYSATWSNGLTGNLDSVLSPGVYTVTVSGINGCSATSSITLTTTGPFVPAINATNTAATCTTPAVIIASGGTSYLWSNGSTNSLLSVSTAGTYTVTITGNPGQTASVSVIVTADPLLTTYFADEDDDGYGDPTNIIVACSQTTGATTNCLDCNDQSALANIDMVEVIDLLDNDCSGVVNDICQNISIDSVRILIASDSMYFYWPDMNDATLYNIQWRVQGSASWTVIGSITANITLAKPISPTTTYEYRIRTKCGTTFTSYGAVKTYLSPVDTGSCLRPDKSYVDVLSETTAKVYWDRAYAARKYRMRVKLASVPTWASSATYTISAPGTSLAQTYKSLSGLISGETYHYQLQSWCPPYNTIWSSYTTVRTFKMPNAPTYCPSETGAGLVANPDNLQQWQALPTHTMTLAPNPTTQTTQLILQQDEIAKILTLFDLTGRTLAEWYDVESGFEINLGDLPAGVYFVSSQFSDKQTETVRLVKW
jgi:subtilisin-like proprotein convertase family protein